MSEHTELPDGAYRRTPLWLWQEIKDEAEPLIRDGMSPYDALGRAEIVVRARHRDD